MAKTLKCNVSFGLTAIINTETVQALEEARVEAAEILQDPDVGQLGGEQRAMLRLFADDMVTEQLLEVILRKGLREVIRTTLKEEMCNNETNLRIGEIKVAFEPREV